MKEYIVCPKLVALPDAVQAQFGDSFEVVMINVDENKKSLDQTLAERANNNWGSGMPQI